MFASYPHEEPVPTSFWFWLEAPVPTVIPTCIICVHLCPTESTHAYRFLPTHTHWSPTGITRAHLFSAGSTHAHWSPTGITRAHLFSAGSTHAHWSPTGITRAHLFSAGSTHAHWSPTGITRAHLFSAGSTHAHWSPTGITHAHLFSAGSTHAHWSPTGITHAHLFSAGSTHAHWSPTGITRAHLFSEEGTRAHHLFEQESLMPVSFPPETLVSTVLFLYFFFNWKHPCQLASHWNHSCFLLSTGSIRTHHFFFNKKHPCPVDSYRNYFLQETLVPTGFPQKSPLKSSKWKHKCLYHIFFYLMSRWMFKRKFYAKTKI